jgi:metal-dependent amidase/aminoacylase/carboxypeptidase family protein
VGGTGLGRRGDLDARAGKQLDSLVAIYKQLHANPELSTQEEQTSALIAKELRAAGFEITDHFGQSALPETKAYGVVAVLRNGPGPTHACGHDVHMAVFVGVARLLAQTKDQWSGTLVMSGQPAEEASRSPQSACFGWGRSIRSN